MISKSEAKYQDNPRGTKMCGDCSMFRRPDRCTLVKGTISRTGWCKHWEAKDRKDE